MITSILRNTYNIELRRYSMKTIRNSSSGNGGAGRWQRGKRAWFAPIVLLMMILLSVTGIEKARGQQGVGISELPIVPHSSSILELQSTLRGFLAPRMTTGQREAIATPAQGLARLHLCRHKLASLVRISNPKYPGQRSSHPLRTLCDPVFYHRQAHMVCV